jgi:hypothetical protein
VIANGLAQAVATHDGANLGGLSFTFAGGGISWSGDFGGDMECIADLSWLFQVMSLSEYMDWCDSNGISPFPSPPLV